MKVDTTQSFVIITTGVLPPNMLPENAAELIGGFTAALSLSPYLRSTTLQLSTLDPVKLIEVLAKAVPRGPALHLDGH
ncbi:MAG TPA: hypothetical protein VH374_26335 [Polyangia bacterium]|nr:hypothetical protein [Polyangia bacterium]